MLAPRVNAAGRMSTPDIATRLLLATDEALGDEARALALQLDGENVRRQEEEAEILAAAKKIVQTDPDVGARSVLVVAGEGWHRGVIGIVASKLVDAFHRPAIVLSIEDGVAHGSCRSIPRFDMLGALERCAPPADPVRRPQAGGRADAGGGADQGAPRARSTTSPTRRSGPDDLMPRLRIDGDLTFRGITGGVAAGVAVAGAVRRRQPAAGVRRPRRRDRRRPAQAQGAAPEDGAQAGRPHLPRDRLARGRAARLPDRAQGRARRRLLAGAEPVQWRDVRRADPRRHRRARTRD